MIKIESKNFREDLDDYFAYFVFAIKRTRKQRSPFVVHNEHVIKAIYHVQILLDECDDEDIITQAWKGEYSDSVFIYKLKDMKEWLKNSGRF